MTVQAAALLIQSLCLPASRCQAPPGLADILVYEARAAGQSVELAIGVMGYESRYDPDALGALGEIGLMQVKHSAARDYCRDLISNLWDPATNIRCGLRLLTRARRICGSKANQFIDWLGVYNGSRKCGPTRYARCVVDFLAGKPRCRG